MLDDNLTEALNAEGNAQLREEGRKIGEDAAARALKAGIVDPDATQIPYRPITQPGVWVATQLPVFSPAYLVQRPWFIGRADAFRRDLPPS